MIKRQEKIEAWNKKYTHTHIYIHMCVWVKSYISNIFKSIVIVCWFSSKIFLGQKFCPTFSHADTILQNVSDAI